MKHDTSVEFSCLLEVLEQTFYCGLLLKANFFSWVIYMSVFTLDIRLNFKIPVDGLATLNCHRCECLYMVTGVLSRVYLVSNVPGTGFTSSATLIMIKVSEDG